MISQTVSRAHMRADDEQCFATYYKMCGCVFFGYPELGFPYVLLVVLAGGFIGLMAYLYGAYLGFLDMQNSKGWALPLLIFGAIFLKWDIVLQNIIIDQHLQIPWINIKM